MPWPPRTAKRWIIIAASALTAAWVFAPAAMPMYDSCCTPDEPYRYVSAPPGYRTTPAPTSGGSVVSAPRNQTSPGFVNTGEVGPQASLYLPAHSLALQPAGQELVVTVTPEAPPADAPSDGRVSTNVYRIAAVEDSHNVSLLAGGTRPSLQLRAPSSKQPGPVFEHHDATGWHRTVRTTRAGLDIYQTEINALGDWALVQLKQSAPSNGSGVNLGLLATGILVLLTTGAIMMIRQRRGERNS